MPRGKLSRLRMQAPATTGPASGAQPASSTPASGCGNSISSLKEQRRGIESRRYANPVPSFQRKLESTFSFLWMAARAEGRGIPAQGRDDGSDTLHGGKRRFSPAL